jgi:hypothetical protein
LGLELTAGVGTYLERKATTGQLLKVKLVFGNDYLSAFCGSPHKAEYQTPIS